MQNNYKEFFTLYGIAIKQGCTFSREELITDFSKGKKKSLKDLTPGEYREFIYQLRCRIGQPAIHVTSDNETRNGMRRAIISQFRFIGKNAQDAKAWAEKYGCRGLKKEFNAYSEQELHVLLQNATKMKEDFLKSIGKI